MLFKWKSKAVGGYYLGDIIVIADNLKAAKAKVVRNAKKQNLNMETIKNDLKQDPEIIKENCLFMRGSD